MNSRESGKSEIEAHLIALFHERYGISLTASADLSQIGMDSVAMAEFVMELEERFDVRMDQDVFDVDTISDLAGYIEVRRRVDH